MKNSAQSSISAETVLGLKPPPLLGEGRAQVHREVATALASLQVDARGAGFELEVVSGYRDFERQLLIWNAKASGQRTVLDHCGDPLVVAELADEALMYAILRWSALPGGSRHHWGTDFDVIDRAAIDAQYEVALSVAETEGEGPFAAFHIWLAGHLEAGSTAGFFRPYRVDCGGIAPEPWHLSHAGVARECQNLLDPRKLRALLANSDILLKEPVLDNFDDIFARFIWVDWNRYPVVP